MSGATYIIDKGFISNHTISVQNIFFSYMACMITPKGYYSSATAVQFKLMVLSTWVRVVGWWLKISEIIISKHTKNSGDKKHDFYLLFMTS